MATELIRIDVIEHKVSKDKNGKIKKGGGSVTRTKTPEEIREAQEKKLAREKAKASRDRARAIRSGVVYGAMAVRKSAQIGGEIAGMVVSQSYARQIFDSNMQGDTRKAQLLQNKKIKVQAVTSFVTTNVNNIASTAAGFAINPVLGLIQLSTYVTQLGLDLINQMQTYSENMRQYQAKADRQILLSEYMRKRLLVNTFNNRGFF